MSSSNYPLRKLLLYSLLLAGLFVSFSSGAALDADGGSQTVRILVVSMTQGDRHASVAAGNRALRQFGERLEREYVENSVVDILDSSGSSTDTPPDRFPAKASMLEEYDVVVFNNSSGLELDEDQRAAFETYIRSGGGVVGIHAAADNPRAGSFFDRVIGATHADHVQLQEGTVHVTDRTHPSTAHLPVEWSVDSTWYTFQSNPRGDVHILMSADGRTHPGSGMAGTGPHHPMAWCHRVGGGRAWYTALGHSSEQFKNDDVRDHLFGGIRWAAGLVDNDATGTVWNAYTKTPLATETKSPAVVEVAPDGRVFFVDRLDYRDEGRELIGMVDPETENGATTVLELAVSDERIYGLKDILFDPEFENNGWMYVFYDPPSDQTDGNIARVSRFTVDGRTIDRDSEVEVLRIPIDPNDGHHGGHLAWGPNGEQLYISIGDNVGGSQYAPLDEREGRARRHDVQRTAGNSADLRGSILRIIPKKDGSYSIPDDNLFTEKSGYGKEIEAGRVHPEIYVMGVRNPYRIAVDPATGVLYWGEYGPGAGSWDVNRGPPQIEEFNRAESAGFYGYPFLIGKNIPFRKYDYANEEGGRIFDPDGPTNDSPNNTGLRELPPAKEPMIMMPGSWEQVLDYPDAWEAFVPYDTLEEVPFPQITGGEPIQGPVYRQREGFDERALPDYYDGKVFLMERGKNWLKYVTLDESGRAVMVEPFMPGTKFTRPVNMDVGPEGALYLAEWGSGYEGPNEDSGIYRIEHRSRTAKLRFHETSDASWSLPEGGSARLTMTVANRHRVPILSGRVSLQTVQGASVQVEPEQEPFGNLPPGQSTEVSWTLSADEDAGGENVPLSAELRYTTAENGTNNRVVRKETSIPVKAQLSVPFGLNLGGDTSIKAEGITFQPTPHPQVQSNNVRVSGTEDSISGTDHQKLYQTLEWGPGLSYEIPVSNGTYDVTFYFLENHFNDTDKRVFSVDLEGETMIDHLDIYSEVGHDAALQKTIERVRVTDGRLSVTTNTHSGAPSICAIALRSGQKEGADTAGETAEEEEAPTGSMRTVEISAGDNMVYDLEEFTVSPGQTVRLTFSHTGNLAAQAMGHNVVILNNPELNPVAFGRKASGDGTVENDYLPEGVRGDVLAATDLLGGGESDTITFKAPEKSGKYPFLCSFPRHAASMNGEMVVQGE